MPSNAETRTVKSIAQGLAKHEFSSREITELCLKQTEQVDSTIKAYNVVADESAIKAAAAADDRRRNGRALGIFDGVPYVAKDIVEVEGVETTGSSNVLKGNIPTRTASTVERLDAAGGVLLGKVNTHQFAYGVQSPPTRNPWDMETARVPGGSSGGTGAAVASAQAPFGLGTDTGGSIRIPACLNGITGLKATYGRVPKDGVYMLSWSLDHIGPMCWTAEDAAITLNIVAGYDERDPTCGKVPTEDYTADLNGGVRGLRIGVPTNYFVSHFSGVSQAFDDSVATLRGAGAEIVPVTVPEDAEALLQPAGFAIVLAESAAWHAPRLRRQQADYQPDVASYLQVGEIMLATDYINAQRYRSRFNAEMKALWNENRLDVMVTPTLAVTAAQHGQMEYEAADGFEETLMSASIRCTFPFNFTGQPALTVPNGFDEKGLPTGLQIIGRPWADALCLRVGHAFQQETDFHAKRPDLTVSA